AGGPNEWEWRHMRAPGWMRDRGWSLAAEVGGITARDRPGPASAPAIAWLKRRTDATTVVLGGRHIGAGTATAALRLNGSPLEAFPLTPGFFMRVLTLPAGALNGPAEYQPLNVTSIGDASLAQVDP